MTAKALQCRRTKLLKRQCQPRFQQTKASESPMHHQPCDVRPDDAGLNDFVSKHWTSETAPSLNHAVMEYVRHDFKLRRKFGIAASRNWTTTEFCPIVSYASIGLLTLSFRLNGLQSALLRPIASPPKVLTSRSNCTKYVPTWAMSLN